MKKCEYTGFRCDIQYCDTCIIGQLYPLLEKQRVILDGLGLRTSKCSRDEPMIEEEIQQLKRLTKYNEPVPKPDIRQVAEETPTFLPTEVEIGMIVKDCINHIDGEIPKYDTQRAVAQFTLKKVIEELESYHHLSCSMIRRGVKTELYDGIKEEDYQDLVNQLKKEAGVE